MTFDIDAATDIELILRRKWLARQLALVQAEIECRQALADQEAKAPPG
jgi:hypothetical protein